jgi:hypothetical protein
MHKFTGELDGSIGNLKKKKQQDSQFQETFKKNKIMNWDGMIRSTNLGQGSAANWCHVEFRKNFRQRYTKLFGKHFVDLS